MRGWRRRGGRRASEQGRSKHMNGHISTVATKERVNLGFLQMHSFILCTSPSLLSAMSLNRSSTSWGDLGSWWMGVVQSK